MTELAFVLAPGQNHFFFELAEVLAAELRDLGMRASVGTAGFPEPREDLVYGLLPPHEYFVLEGTRRAPPPGALRRTIFIGAEQPATVHFHQNAALAARAGAFFDINARAVRAYRRRGLRAHHLPLGYTRHWDRFAAAGERETGVLFLGAHTPRRGAILAAGAMPLAAAGSRIVLSDNSRPNTDASTSFLAGEEKWNALCGARTLLNIHQGPEPYFEWHRALQAIHCGTALVSEPSTDLAPLQAGVHLLEAPSGELAARCAELAGRPADAAGMARAAYELIRDEVPLAAAAERLAGVAEDVRARPSRPGLGSRALSRLSAVRVRAAATRPRRPPGERRDPAPPLPAILEDLGAGTLITAPGCRLLPGGREALVRALDDDPDAGWSYGLVATAGGVANPFGWEAGFEAAPPVLAHPRVVSSAVGPALAAMTAAAAIAAVASAAPGVNAQTFVARQDGGVPKAVGDAAGG